MAAGLACGGPPPPLPSPVILATPTTVCLGDDYKTRITLDGTQSSAALTLIPSPPVAGAPPLQFVWTLAGSAYRIVHGTLTSDTLVVTIAGQEPLQVDLEVRNGSGTSAVATETVSVTLLDAGVCPLRRAGPASTADGG